MGLPDQKKVTEIIRLGAEALMRPAFVLADVEKLRLYTQARFGAVRRGAGGRDAGGCARGGDSADDDVDWPHELRVRDPEQDLPKA
jgi:hypothetical protein